MLNDRNKNFSVVINKIFLCALDYYSMLCTVICISTVTVTLYSSDILSVGACTTLYA